MKYLLDTNAVRALMDENERFLQHLDALHEDNSVQTSIFTFGEVWYGIEVLPGGKRRAELERKAEAAFMSLPVGPVEKDAAMAYSRIKAELKRKGRPFDNDNDLWIAGVALAHDMVLVTADDHFKEVEGLRVEDWTA